MLVLTPSVGQKYVAIDNAGAVAALIDDRYPVPSGLIYVTVKKVWPVERKVQVNPDGMWLTYDELAEWFRPVNPQGAASNQDGGQDGG